MSTLASERAIRSISCESSAITPLVPINCSLPSCLIMRFPSLPRVSFTGGRCPPDPLTPSLAGPLRPTPLRRGALVARLGRCVSVKSAISIDNHNHEIRSHQSEIRNLLACLAQEIFQAPPTPLVHRREHRADAVQRHARRQSDAAPDLHVAAKRGRTETRFAVPRPRRPASVSSAPSSAPPRLMSSIRTLVRRSRRHSTAPVSATRGV